MLVKLLYPLPRRFPDHALGEMFRELSPMGIQVPDGFAITADAYRYFLQENGLEEPLRQEISELPHEDVKALTRSSRRTRDMRCKVGICGQAPSDYPDFAAFLVEKGIDSISLSPDAVVSTTLKVLEVEKGETPVLTADASKSTSET